MFTFVSGTNSSNKVAVEVTIHFGQVSIFLFEIIL